MKFRAARSRRSSILFAGIAAACVTATARAVVLTSNLSLPQDGVEQVSTMRWLGSQFMTDGNSYLINAITLRIQQNVPGAVQVSLFSDAGGRPGQMLATLSTASGIGGNSSLVTFRGDGGSNRTTGFSLDLSRAEAASSGLGFGRRDVARAFGKNRRVNVSGDRPTGLGLAAGTNYWIVTRALSGSFSLGYTDQEIGQGAGYSPVWAKSSDAGATWTTERNSPLFLEVVADPNLLLDDQEAIISAVFSGLPMALAQREAVFTAVRNVVRDVNERLFRLRSAVPLPGVAEGEGKKAMAQPESRWELFATASYGYADHETFLPAAGFETNTWVETVGAEYRVSDRFSIGAAFTYAQSNNAIASSVGDVDLEGEAITAYASYHDGRFYADALYSYAMFEHDIQRDTLFGNTASAEPNSRTHTLQLNLGYNLPVAGFVTGPYASIDWMIGELESYEEANGNTLAGSARLRVPGQTFDSLISRIGWQISRTFAIESVKLTPQLRAAWAHEYRDELEFVDVQLATSPFKTLVGSDVVPVGRFNASAETQAPGSDVFEVGFTLGVEWDERFRVFVDYTAHLFQNHAFAHQVSLTGEVKF